jgi:hypothetical protein
VTLNRVCEVCGEGFYQYRGRPAKRCPEHRRGGDRYGAQHRAMKQAGPTPGELCTRCGGTLLPGQALEPDHLDGGGPTDYAGWAHASCNHSAGAARGNQLRAAAYRAAKGLPALNGSGTVMVREPPPAHRCDQDGCHPVIGGPCGCGRHSRAW